MVVLSFDSVPTGQVTQITEISNEYALITLLADPKNTATVYVGDQSALFPLVPGAAIDLRNCNVSEVFSVCGTTGQVIHCIASGSIVQENVNITNNITNTGGTKSVPPYEPAGNQ